jgi:hypothetical protein
MKWGGVKKKREQNKNNRMESNNNNNNRINNKYNLKKHISCTGRDWGLLGWKSEEAEKVSYEYLKYNELNESFSYVIC